MSPLPPHRSEREALCDLFLELGPDRPTLCEGWDTTDLAVHLIVRERKPLAAPGILVGGPFASYLDKTSAKMETAHTYEQLVDLVRTGPPLPMRWIDSLVNTQEYFVHHEDARRGGGDTSPRPEAEIAEVEEALWKGLQKSHRMSTRRIKGVQVDLVRDDSGGADVIHSGQGDDVLRISGRPGEIVLYVVGRTEAAQVQVVGNEAALAALDASTLNI